MSQLPSITDGAKYALSWEWHMDLKLYRRHSAELERLKKKMIKISWNAVRAKSVRRYSKWLNAFNVLEKRRLRVVPISEQMTFPFLKAAMAAMRIK